MIAGSSSTSTTARIFIATPAQVTVAAGQKVFFVSHAALGAHATAATGLNIYPCYRLAGATTSPIVLLGGILGLAAPPQSRQIYSISGDVSGLTAGTYEVAMCGEVVASVNNWTNNEWSYTTALVHN